MVLTAPVDVVGTRFRLRRRELEGDHPEADLPEERIDAAIREANGRLDRPGEGWTRVVVDATADVESVHRAVVEAIG